jgi:Ca2+-transporting ATPase
MIRHAVPLERLPDLLASERGLEVGEAEDRRRRYGANAVVEVAGRPWLDLARDTAKDPMIWFFAGVSVLYALVGQVVEALTLLIAIVPLIGMDAFLHRRTQASTGGLRSRLAARARVLRDGVATEIPAIAVVPGDLAIVSTGEPFPADGIIVAGSDLQVDESALTGEAYPVNKQPLTAAPSGAPPIVDAAHWGFAGTRLLTGRASLRVAFTGGETIYGEIVRSAVSGTHARTPLQGAIQRLVAVLLVAASALCLILAGIRLWQGYGWLDAVVSAVTLATAAIPEEFPVVFTFFLGVGVYRLGKHQALVRRAVSVENIGRVTCICSDKTGTITEGRLELRHRLPATDLEGTRLLFLAALASRAESGDPLDVAILTEAQRTGALSDGRPRALATFPFTEGRKRETAVVGEAEDRLLVATKGATETVLPMSELDAADREAWSGRVTELAEAGHRVIACAWRSLDRSAWAGREPEQGYRFAGLLAFEDPVREGVVQAVRTCREAGIHTIMVTGDHPLTARAVAREIGLGDGRPRVIVADDVEAQVGRGLGATLRQVDVIARAAPSQKLALVRGLQKAGEIVAVTGDGVNDVPALQAADIGVAMGARGTRSAREVAAIVLLDDNFQTIVRAIGEGRQLFRNLQLAFQYLLAIHIPFVVTAALIPLAGFPLLYLPVHVVWLEMIIHPTALLVFQELPTGEALEESRRQGRFFSSRDWSLVIAMGTLVTALVAAGYLWSLGSGRDVAHARAMALVALTLSSAVITAGLTRLRTVAARIAAASTVALSVALVQVPAPARLLHLTPLHLDDWAMAVAGALVAALGPLVVGGFLGRDRPEAVRA